MYIVNQSNNEIVKIESIKMYSCYNDEIQRELLEIYNRMIVKAYNYGSTENCNKAIKETQERHLINKPKEYRISVNNNDFAVYKNKLKAEIIFNDIQTAIGRNENIYKLCDEFRS